METISVAVFVMTVDPFALNVEIYEVKMVIIMTPSAQALWYVLLI